MPFKLSHLSPNFVLQKIDQRCPRFETFRKDPMVQKVAKQVFIALSCISFGAGLGLVVVTPLGLGLFAGIGIGAGVGAFAYFAVTGVKWILEKYGFPVSSYRTSPPLAKDRWFSDKNYKEFEKVFTDEISQLNCYNQWKGIQSDAKAKKKLWKECQNGFCQSEAQNLISLLKDHPDLKGQLLLNKIEAKELFHRQLLEIIRADLSNNLGIADLAKSIPNAEEVLYKDFTKKQLDKYKNPDKLLLSYVSRKLKPADKYQAVAFTLRLQNDTDPAHTLFVQLHPVLRFYDPYNPVFTGFFEGFKKENEKEFLIKLQRHLRGYHSKTRPTALRFDKIIIRGYRIDCPSLREKAEIVKAGANPILN